jgi:hypothetical protein
LRVKNLLHKDGELSEGTVELLCGSKDHGRMSLGYPHLLRVSSSAFEWWVVGSPRTALATRAFELSFKLSFDLGQVRTPP